MNSNTISEENIVIIGENDTKKQLNFIIKKDFDRIQILKEDNPSGTDLYEYFFQENTLFKNGIQLYNNPRLIIKRLLKEFAVRNPNSSLYNETS